ncbi:MAG: RNA polymerase sigma factor [Syntrophobacteraceae bacterium]
MDVAKPGAGDEMTEDSDYQLIQAIGTGNTNAFEHLVERFQKPVLNFIFRYLGDRFAAEDITQEVFLRVYRSAGGFRPEGKVSSWIFRIAYNLSINEINRRARLPCITGDDELARFPAPDATSHHEMNQAVMKSIGGLPENQRAALILRVYEGLSYSEISKVLSVSVPSVESLIFRARDKLRKLLED